MHTRFMKLTVGALAAIVAAIVAGPAFGGSLSPSYPPQHGYPPTRYVQQLASGSSYSAFPEVVRTMNDTKRSLPITSVRPSRTSLVTAGYSAFPEVVRTMKDAAANKQGVTSSRDSFNWSDAGVGLAIGIGAACVLAFAIGIRRSRTTPVPA